MANFIIRPKDYNNLEGVSTERNIITNISGEEYSVQTNENTLIDERTITIDTTSQLFSNTPYNNNNAIINNNLVCIGDYVSSSDAKSFARTESLYTEGSFEFYVDRVITDCSCEFSINYTKYLYNVGHFSSNNRLNEDNYKSQNITILFRDEPFSTTTNDGNPNISSITSENEFLSLKKPIAEILTFLGVKKIEVPFGSYTSKDQYVQALISYKSETQTKIKVRYRLRNWTASYEDKILVLNQPNINALMIDSINVKTYATTLETKSNKFNYKIDSESEDYAYNLESNELMQYVENQSEDTRLSKITAQKIFDNFSEDRQIITFDLLNPIKQTIDDNLQYNNASENYRFIESNDTFEIFRIDETNKESSMGIFRVIKCNAVWNGFYHKQITAIKLKNS